MIFYVKPTVTLLRIVCPNQASKQKQFQILNLSIIIKISHAIRKDSELSFFPETRITAESVI